MRKLSIFILLMMMLATVALAGCGDDDDTVDGDTADGDTTDGDTTDGDTTDGDTTDGDTTDGDTTDGDTTDGDTADGDTTDGDTADGDTADGDTADGDTADGDTADGDTADGDTADGDTADGDTADGDTADGDTPDGDTTDGDMTDGDTIDGDTTDGDMTDGDTTDGDSSGPNLRETTNSSCLGTRTGDSEDPFGVESVEASYNPTTGLVTAIHHNVIYNCCIESIGLDLVVDGNTLKLYETEILDMPCNCICPYDVETQIADLEDGSYTVEFYKDGGDLAGSAQVTVGDGATLSNVQNSDCLGNTRTTVDGDEDGMFPAATFEANYDSSTGAVTAIHHNAVYNCCIDSIDVDLVQDGTTLKLYETEQVDMPCACVCPYDVSAQIDDLADGVYTVEFYLDGGQLAGSAQVTVGGVQLAGVRNSDCLNGATRTVDGDDDSLYGTESFEASYDAETGLATATHHNAVYNCCIDEISVELVQDGNTLKLYETEVAPNPCFCVCPFDISAQVAGLADGLYTVEFYNNDGNLAGSTSLTVGAAPELQHNNSDCLGSGFRDSTDETLTANWETDHIAVLHHNAEYNCCIDEIAVAMAIDGFTITLTETEMLQAPCDCVCLYDVNSSIYDLPSGDYTINVMVWNQLYDTAYVTVP